MVEVYSLEDGVYQLQQKGKDFIFDFSIATSCNALIDFKERW